MTRKAREGKWRRALGLAVILAMPGGSGALHAQATEYLIPPANERTAPSAEPTIRRNLILRHTARVTGSNFGDGAVPPGMQPLHPPINLLCPRDTPGRCTIEVSQNVQVMGTASNNRWGICTQIDGLFMNEPGCPFLGIIPTGSVAQSGSFVQSQSGIARGQRSVQTFVYTEGGATVGLYSLTYRVYKLN